MKFPGRDVSGSWKYKSGTVLFAFKIPLPLFTLDKCTKLRYIETLVF